MGTTDGRTEWICAKNELADDLKMLRLPEGFAELLAKQLGGPKAIRRMCAYLRHAKPRSIEEVVDEALAIRSEIDAWRRKKEAEEANSKYNELLNYGLDDYDIQGDEI
ncbi:MAG: hypothetical protein IKX54_02000 [Lachnospiraceae bacterium]|nr:hypothetical protein [Lachnospiraceae bacterium]